MAEEICVVTADDCSIEVVSESDTSGCYSEIENISHDAKGSVSHRKDITEMENVLCNLEEKLTFKNKEMIEEELDSLKSRRNFEPLCDAELKNVHLALKALEEKDLEFYKELQKALEMWPKIIQLAKMKDASLKRPLEILEEFLPLILAACELEYVEPSNAPSEALDKYQQSRSEMKCCEEEFDMDGRKEKQTESSAHLDEAMVRAKEGREQSEALVKKDEERNLLKQIKETKENVGILVLSELEDLKGKFLACASDIKEIESSQEQQKIRIEEATASYKVREKRNLRKIKDLEQRQTILEKQLEEIEKEKEKLIKNAEHEKEVQKEAENLNEQVVDSLSELHENICAIWGRVEVLSDILQLLKTFSNTLFDSARNAQVNYEGKLKRLEVQALSQQWNVLAHGVVDNMLEMDNINANIMDYEKRMKELRNDMTSAARRGQAAIVKKSKEDMRIFEQELELQKALLLSLTDKLTQLHETHKEVNDRLVERGITLGSIVELYNQKKANQNSMGTGSPDSLFSLDSYP